MKSLLTFILGISSILRLVEFYSSWVISWIWIEETYVVWAISCLIVKTAYSRTLKSIFLEYIFIQQILILVLEWCLQPENMLIVINPLPHKEYNGVIGCVFSAVLPRTTKIHETLKSGKGHGNCFRDFQKKCGSKGYNFFH